jgi:protein-L-isoaspartate(D-aspartate) O-methyltransferase
MMRKNREDLVSKLLEMGYIQTDIVKEAMNKVPREEFMTPETKNFAYLDRPIPLEQGQTISAPHMVAIICEKLALEKGMNVLEIGTGFGYNAAVVSEIIGAEGHVYTIERIEKLKNIAEQNLRRTGYGDRVTVIYGDGTNGYEKKSPYDRIYATASAPKIPEPLKKQLKIGGRLLTPIGRNTSVQELLCLSRVALDEYKSYNLGGVVFVPMIGEHGWPE